jgi:serine/threonine-protein kinase
MSDSTPIGSLIAGKYRVLRELGSGGMGSLVEAEHPVLKRTVAIKLVRGRTSAQAFRRLIQEAEAAQALHSEHVVRVFDVGYHADAPYIVMERLVGSDLASMLEDGPFAIEDAVDCVLEACVGIAEAHALGIVHRDVKPANLFLTRGGGQKRVVKVLDFGISKQLDLESDEADPATTAPNQMLGSPYFMSPEQLRNPAKVDGRTDVWALGVTLYNLLTGELPFEGPTVSEVTGAVFTDEPRDIREHRADLPDALVAAISACLVKRAGERTPNVRALAEAIVPFAGKRGRMAAERITTLSEEAPAEPPVRERPSRSLEVTATDAGLSATLPADAVSQRAPSTDSNTGPGEPAPRGWRVPALAASAAAALLVSWWFLRPTPTPTPAAGATPSTKSEVAPPAPDAAPVVVPTTRAPSESVTTAAKPKVRRTQPPSKPRASASASAAPPEPAPSPRVDIDGIPIVE